MRIVPNLKEYQEALDFENKGELINVLHQKQIDNNTIDLILSFNKPKEGKQPGEMQNIETLSNNKNLTIDDLDDDDLMKIKELFVDALISYIATKDGLSVDEFPEFEAEGIDDILYAPNVEDYSREKLNIALNLIENKYAIVIEKLNEAVNTEIFVTDLGISHVIKPDNGAEFTIPRYGIWSIKPNQKPNIIETSDNLDGLLEKYKLTESDVVKLMN